MGSSIKVDGNTEVVIPGILSIKGGEIVLDNLQAKVLSAVASSKKSEKVAVRELAIAESIGDGIPLLTAKKKGGAPINPNSFSQKLLAIVKPLLSVKRYDSKALLNEVEKIIPGLDRGRANTILRAKKEVKYEQGIWSLPENEIPVLKNKGSGSPGRPINPNSLAQKVLAMKSKK